MNALRNCGEMYRLERIVRVPQKPSTPAVAGKVIHTATETIDHLIHEGQTDSLALEVEALKVAERELTALIAAETEQPDTWKRYGRATSEKPNGEDIQWFAQAGIPSAITSYIAWREASGLELVVLPGFGPAIEVPFEMHIQGQLIHGYIDRIFHKDNNPLLVDLKSGQKPKTDEQLGIYRHALAGVLDVRYGAYLYAMKTGKPALTNAIDLTHWTEAKFARVYVEGSKLIDQGIFIPAPGEQCHRCSVADHCDFRAAAL